MQFKVSRRVASAFAIVIGLTGSLWYSGQSSGAVAPDEQGAVVVNKFKGTYVGGYWGNVPGLGPYGGDVKATVSSTGALNLTLPGKGTGTVAPNGANFNVGGVLKVNGQNVKVSYTGSLKAIKNPANGAFLGVIGSGTWKTTTPGVNATGKWLIQRTAI